MTFTGSPLSEAGAVPGAGDPSGASGSPPRTRERDQIKGLRDCWPSTEPSALSPITQNARSPAELINRIRDGDSPRFSPLLAAIQHDRHRLEAGRDIVVPVPAYSRAVLMLPLQHREPRVCCRLSLAPAFMDGWHSTTWGSPTRSRRCVRSASKQCGVLDRSHALPPQPGGADAAG